MKRRTARWGRRWWIVWSAAALVACAAGSASPQAGEVVPAALLEFIETGAGPVLHPGFAKYAYGSMAEGLLRWTGRNPALGEAFTPLIGRIVRTLIDRAPASSDGLTRPGDHGNYLANLNLALGAYKKITGRDDYRELNERVTRHLAARSGVPPYHFPPYPGTSLRFPADQAFVLYTITLFDENYGTSLAPPLIARWSGYIASSCLEAKTGLPVSEITGGAPWSKRPRGCALSYLILYTAKFDPDRAAAWFAAYTKYFLKDYLVAAGFRETADEKFKADADSGPIVDGVGAAATAFGIGAARSLGDFALASKLERLVSLGKERAARLGGKNRAAASDIVAQAIEFNMTSQMPVR